ncbi:MAG: UDP-N-acetylglucosamine--N-acetylmuramyl-(pentapeptide) pyrophosphoryl-undecaprenol N-acetylglucosamine transferase, partial [Ktedonobacteraceae bacterium]|nr:UDP-N-acetylglucosamine--N-acetylmuramyl-(pentapeptide) pyrophosphoryl-undecaprenol N-acetylglucosamine transferase [Ktedonobacteraceae bacterium]
GTMKGIARVPVGVIQAISIVRNFHADVAFTSGGYVAVPAGLAARMNGVPLLIHQQDVPPNLSNKLLAPLATRISVAFADSLHYFPAHKTVQLGNPVRQAVLDVRQTSPQDARMALGLAADVPLLLVTGGSQGARYLNQTVCRALPELLLSCQVLQISGKKLFEETQALSTSMLADVPAETRQRYRLVPYMDAEMPLALQAAEMVVCRAGAATLSELAVLGKPSILVPLPPALGASPQETNASMFGHWQAAEVIQNNELKPDILVNRVKSDILDYVKLNAMAEAARRLAKPDATQEIVKTIVGMIQKQSLKTFEARSI